MGWGSILSRAGPAKSRLKSPVPSGKAKYVERPKVNQYREGKVKSTLNKGVKQTLKPCAHKRSELGNLVTACLLHNEPTSYASLARLRVFKARSRSESESEQGAQSEGVDAKLGDLPLTRMKAP
jgi:hypothetical protein